MVEAKTPTQIAKETGQNIPSYDLSGNYLNSNVISPNDLKPTTPINLAGNNVDPSKYNTSFVTADLTSQLDAQQKNVDALLQRNQQEASLKSQMESLLGGKTAETNKVYQEQGVTDLYNKLKGLSAQQLALQQESQLIPSIVQEQNKNTGATDAGVAPQTTGKLRENAIKSYQIGFEASQLSGQYDRAKSYADNNINAKYDQLEADIKAKQTNLDALDKYTLTPAQEKLKLTQQTLLKRQEQDLADKKEQQSTYSKLAIDGGDSQLASKITALDPQSPTFKQDLAGLQAQIKQNQLEKAQIANIYSQIAERNRNTGTSEDPANIIAYAQQYASTGSIPVGLPKGTFGTVSQIAKDLPKQDGVIVDNNTNIKSSKLTSAQVDAYSAMKDLTVKIQQADDLFKQLNTGIVGGTLGNIFPTQTRQEYNTLKNEIIDLLARARTGAAISANEEKLYRDKIPGTFNQSFFIGTSGDTKLTGLKKSISDKLDTQLKAEGVSMYGFSKIKLGDKEYKVGDIIESNGHQGRINPDGSITPIN